MHHHRILKGIALLMPFASLTFAQAPLPSRETAPLPASFLYSEVFTAIVDTAGEIGAPARHYSPIGKATHAPRYVCEYADLRDQKSPDWLVSADFALLNKDQFFGLITNNDPVYSVQGNAQWRWFGYQMSLLGDLTSFGKQGGWGDRKWKYEKLNFTPYLTLNLARFNAWLAYNYEQHPIPKNAPYRRKDGQQVKLQLGAPGLLSCIDPSLYIEYQIREPAHGLYFYPQIAHTVKFRELEKLSLNLFTGLGLGSPTRNRNDTKYDYAPKGLQTNWALRDWRLGFSLDYAITAHLRISCFLYNSFQVDGRIRRSARDNFYGSDDHLFGGVQLHWAY